MALLSALLSLLATQAAGQTRAGWRPHFDSERVCCMALTADCLACAEGVTVEQFCSDQRHMLVPGCRGRSPAPRPVAGGGSAICGRFHEGEKVSAVSRGQVRIFCESARSTNVVGICQAPYTGHNNYQNCRGGRQGGCPPKALWFVHCEELVERLPEPEPLPDHEETDESPATSSLCGCSYNTRDGCVVSTGQLLASLTNKGMVERACQKEHAFEECAVRKSQAEKASRFITKCLGLTPFRCRMMAPTCQWAAQGSGECGVDEHQLMLELAGESHLVRLIESRKNCSKHTEGTCMANEGCRWVHGSEQAMCDVDSSILIREMFRNPTLVMILQRSTEEAMCRVRWESHSPGSCPESKCRMLDGICQAKREDGQSISMEMMTSLCMRSWSESGTCPRPCLKTRTIHGETCRGHPGLSFGYTTTAHREHLVKVMAVLMSSLWPYQQQCMSAMHSHTCQLHGPTCDEKVSPALVLREPAHAAAFVPGLKGALQRASSAMATGRAGQLLDDHFENTAEDLANFTKMAFDSLSSLFKSTAPPSTEPPTTPEPDAEVPVAVEEPHGSLDLEPEVMNLWLVAGVAALVAAVCSGVALGVLCHARLVRGQAREPLLAGSRAEAAAAAPGRDNEMDPMSGNN